jgi:hypothetical protein
MKYVIVDTRNRNYLVRQNCAHTRCGFQLEYIMGRWLNALRIESKRVAEGVAIAMWPIGAMQANPYEVEEVSK